MNRENLPTIAQNGPPSGGRGDGDNTRGVEKGKARPAGQAPAWYRVLLKEMKRYDDGSLFRTNRSITATQGALRKVSGCCDRNGYSAAAIFR